MGEAGSMLWAKAQAGAGRGWQDRPWRRVGRGSPWAGFDMSDVGHGDCAAAVSLDWEAASDRVERRAMAMRVEGFAEGRSAIG